MVDDETKFGNNVGTYESMSKEDKDSGKREITLEMVRWYGLMAT